MIPKIIHYCWFGRQKKPGLIRKCIASWQKFMPDWEIREWNEENYDTGKNEYMRKAYEEQKWAFVVDYARFDILNQFGGIFLDTDVELLRPIPDSILANEAFTGFEDIGRVNPGLVYGSAPGQKILKEIMAAYESRSYGGTVDGRPENIVDIVSDVLIKNGLKINGEFQIVGGAAIYPKDYFCCFNFETQGFETTGNTVSIHHYFASWTPPGRRIHFKIIKWAAAVLGKERYLWLKRKVLRKQGRQQVK